MSDLKLVLGFFTGQFTTRDTGEVKIYHNLSVAYPRNGATGIFVERIPVRGENPFVGIQVGDYVETMYDKFGNCTRIDPVEPSVSDIADFKYINDVMKDLVADK